MENNVPCEEREPEPYVSVTLDPVSETSEAIENAEMTFNLTIQK